MARYVTGAEEVAADLTGLGRDLDDMPEAYAAIGREYVTLLGRFAPHRSGNLARSLQPVKSHGAAVVTAGNTRVRYAGPINYGWPRRHIRASRFVAKADEAIVKPALQILERGVQKAITRRGL